MRTRVYKKGAGFKLGGCSDELTAGVQKSVLVEEGAQVAKTACKQGQL